MKIFENWQTARQEIKYRKWKNKYIDSGKDPIELGRHYDDLRLEMSNNSKIY